MKRFYPLTDSIRVYFQKNAKFCILVYAAQGVKSLLWGCRSASETHSNFVPILSFDPRAQTTEFQKNCQNLLSRILRGPLMVKGIFEPENSFGRFPLVYYIILSTIIWLRFISFIGMNYSIWMSSMSKSGLHNEVFL